ncbi:MAG: hypothetical protein U1F56_12470 [Rubrivivax sp.]
MTVLTAPRRHPLACRAAVGAALLALLTGCGGGDRAASPPGTSSAAAGSGSRLHALAASSLEGVSNEDTWLSITGFAQASYPSLFPGDPTVQPFGDGRSYTYGNGNAIGFQGSQIYLSGPQLGGPTPTPYQSLSTFCGHTPQACSVTVRRTVTWENREREYFVYVPWAVRQGRGPVPTVMLIHGSGGHGKVPLNEWGWKTVADREGLLLAAPSALLHCYVEDADGAGPNPPASFSVETKWASGPLGLPTRRQCTLDEMNQLVTQGRMSAQERTQASHPVPDDVGGLRELARLLVSDWGADARRLYVSGFSNGGEMAFRLAAEASTTFAAVASAAGVVQQDEMTWPVATRPMSMVYSVGSLNLRGQPVSTSQDIMATNSDLSSRTAAFLAILGLSDAHRFQNQTVAGFDTGVYVYNTSTRPTPGGNTLYVGVMAGLEHEYPSTLPDTLWAFFRTQTLP